MLVWPFKDPAEVLDYDIDWTLRLAGDTIVTSTWSMVTTDGLLTIASQSFTTLITKAVLSGGTLGFVYILQNMVTTAGLDTMTEAVELMIRTK